MLGDFQILVLDVDGVVVKKDKVFSVRLSEKLGIPIDKISPFFKNEFQQCLVGKADLKEEIAKYLDIWGWRETEEELFKFWFDGERDVNDDILKLVQKLKKKGIHAYLASNNEKYRVDYLVNTVGLGKYFDHTFSSAELGYKKPESEFYNLMLQKIGVTNLGEVMFWDDDPENVEGAKEVGIEACLYKDFEEFREALKLKFKV
jgi:putative hydrolase of the HAD superfamily